MQQVKGYPYLRLMNPKLTDLDGLIWEPWQDLDLVACIRAETEDEVIYANVQKGTDGIDEKEFFAEARERMRFMADFRSLSDMIQEIAEEEGEDPEEFKENNGLYVVTGKDMKYGASMITLPSVKEWLDGNFERYYIIPASKHEMIIWPTDRRKDIDINKMIREVNATQVRLEDWLSDHAHYCKNGEISCVMEQKA